ncbi:hypothetical protein OF001_U20368 [Pseudomonas sp. OF001]|uniref:hypothetical protein n=1 Tax=Pseudomonas sp. OF001 TaxID=2772300 RepID=UPI00191A5129|nr:hypothetical protein [Pseudomonas sp. OF001]CAD5377441.1 hypothetical protein OF001_U20368 [Pseudomonas sp. OF001]
MAFADLFRNLSQRLPTAMNDPMLQLGLQLMQAGGPQAQQMSTGQRLAAAAQGFQAQQAQQQQLDHAAVLNRLREIQASQSEREIKSAEQLQQRMADPAFLASLPEFSRKMAEAGATPAQLWQVFEGEQRLAQAREQGEALQAYRQQQLGIQQQRADAYVGRQHQLAAGGGTGPAVHGPKVPTPRQTVDMPLDGNMVQRMMFNPQTGQYEPFGAPFKRGAQGNNLLGALGIGEDGQPVPDAGQQAGEQPKPWSDLPTGSRAAPQAPAVQQVPVDVEFNANGVPVPTGHRPVQQPAPIAAGGGGMARAQDDKAAAFAADLAQAQRLLQANPQLREEIDRRLRVKYGRGL